MTPVLCYAGQINQVFMNILSTSVDTLIDQAVSQQLNSEFTTSSSHPTAITPIGKPTIEITTQVRSMSSGQDSSRWVSIRIADNGPGLSAEAQKQILESFSVKKRAEKETSLAVSYQIITAKHGGKFEVRSPSASNQLSSSCSSSEKQNGGTEFEILLPLL